MEVVEEQRSGSMGGGGASGASTKEHATRSEDD